MTPQVSVQTPWFPTLPSLPTRGIDQGYTPGLFVLPAVHNLQSDLVAGEEIHSSLLRISQGMDDTQFVLRDGVGFSRRMLNEIRSERRVALNDFDHGSDVLWDDFSPFSINRFLRQRDGTLDRSGGDGTAEVVYLQPQIVVPAPVAPPAGAESLSARLAALAVSIQ